MTDKEQNRSEVNQEPISKDITGMNSRGKDRRRFIKRAIVAAPFILTVASRPVLAANCTMSGQLSGNLSDAGEPCGGEGCPADYWINATAWHYEFPRGKLFYDVFMVDPFPNSTLYQVITSSLSEEMFSNCSNSSDTGYYDTLLALGVQSVAALENAATSLSFELTVCQVINDFVNAYTSCVTANMVTVIEELNILNNRCPH